LQRKSGRLSVANWREFLGHRHCRWPGVNTLDFVTFNQGGPMGLRVEMSGEADPVPTPTPSPVMGGLVLLGVCATFRTLRLK